MDKLICFPPLARTFGLCPRKRTCSGIGYFGRHYCFYFGTFCSSLCSSNPVTLQPEVLSNMLLLVWNGLCYTVWNVPSQPISQRRIKWRQEYWIRFIYSLVLPAVKFNHKRGNKSINFISRVVSQSEQFIQNNLLLLFVCVCVGGGYSYIS